MSKTFYITTPIYYPSDKLHIGNSYTTVAADAMARYKKQRGYDVFFLTGTDEHGQKIERKAKDKGVTPIAYVDEIVAGIKDLWKLLDIDYDDFIRTTDEKHVAFVQKVFKQLYDQGDIYKSEYEGKYCIPCEAFWTESQLVDGKCPDCGRDVEVVKEESYFFRLSKYQDRLIKLIEETPDFLQPASRQNEMLNNFLRPGLEDLCVSRTTFQWGIPVTFDSKHVVYVWVDALSNYISALNCGTADDSLYQKYWPADVHLVGKDIVRFHAIIWPAMLMALNLPLPKQIFGHGWLLLDSGKMSKSKGNVIDPTVLCERYGVDAIRYFLLREIPFGSDGVFSNESLLNRINSDLANDLGNLVSRTVAMIEKYFEGSVPENSATADPDGELERLVTETKEEYEKLMDQMLFPNALAALWKLVSRCNKYIDETMPWQLAKSEDTKPRLASVMYHLAECIRIISVMLYPFMPATPAKIQAQLGIAPGKLTTWDSLRFGLLPVGTKVQKGDALFPRIDIAKELESLAPTPVTLCPPAQKALDAVKAQKEQPEQPKEITIDDFARVELKVGKILTAEKVEGSDKLLKLSVAIGDETRTIVSGIAKWYTPEEIVGKSVSVVANLKPVKLKGILSQGMLLCAEDAQGHLALVSPEREVAHGAEIR